MNVNVGVVGLGLYIPEGRMKAAEISKVTNGVWSEDAVINKLGIVEKPIPDEDDGTKKWVQRLLLKR